jgi:hypothetical protein
MKSITFENLVEKFVECENSFGKKSTPSTSGVVYLAQKEKSKPHDSPRGDKNRRGHGHGRNTFRGRGGDSSNLHCTCCKKNGSHEAYDYMVPWDMIKEDRENKKEDKGKTSEPTKGNPHESSHCIFSH